MREVALPEPSSFLGVMERTIQLVGNSMPRETLQKVAQVFHTLRWEFQDYGVQVYFLVNDAGEVSCARDWPGPVDSVIVMDASTFHNAAYGKTNFGTALLMGKLRIKGVSPLSLSKFTPLLKPFLDSYQQACSEFNGSVI